MFVLMNIPVDAGTPGNESLWRKVTPSLKRERGGMLSAPPSTPRTDC